MPSPISHTTIGLLVYKKFINRSENISKNSTIDTPLIIIIVVLSMLPDLDTIPGFIAGNLKRFHNSESHSLFVAAGIAFLGAILM